MTMTRSTVTLSFALAVLAFGCSSSSSSPDEPVDSGEHPVADAGKGDGATFTKVYSGVIKNYSCLECHIPGQTGVTQGHLDMSTQANAYKNLVNVAAAGTECESSGLTRVIPDNAAESLIVLKTESSVTHTPPPCGAQMPKGCGTDGGPKHCLADDDLDPLKSWINAGAQNN
jgi:hypothetical protein